MKDTAYEVFKSRKDLAVYNERALMLFALETKFQIEDILTIASDTLIHTTSDKKADLIHIDIEEGYSYPQCQDHKVTKISDIDTGLMIAKIDLSWGGIGQALMRPPVVVER